MLELEGYARVGAFRCSYKLSVAAGGESVLRVRFDDETAADAFIKKLGHPGTRCSRLNWRWSSTRAFEAGMLLGVPDPIAHKSRQRYTRSEPRRCEFKLATKPGGAPILTVRFDDEAAAKVFSIGEGTWVSKNTRRWTGCEAVKVAAELGVKVNYAGRNKPWRLMSDEELIALAKPYATLSAWARGNPRHRQYIHACRKDLLLACTAHMEPPGGYRHQNYQVYAYEFADRSAYVGLTGSPKARHHNHREKGPVAVRLARGEKPTFRVIKERLWAKEAAQLEMRVIARYRRDGWTMLNRTRGGELSLGFSPTRYDDVLRQARTCGKKFEFLKKFRPLYQVAWHKGWLERLSLEAGWKSAA